MIITKVTNVFLFNVPSPVFLVRLSDRSDVFNVTTYFRTRLPNLNMSNMCGFYSTVIDIVNDVTLDTNLWDFTKKVHKQVRIYYIQCWCGMSSVFIMVIIIIVDMTFQCE